MNEPLSPEAARSLIQDIVLEGTVYFSGHARDEMTADHISENTVLDVLFGGLVDDSHLVDGSWRYKVVGGTVTVVVSFLSGHESLVVTAWRD